MNPSRWIEDSDSRRFQACASAGPRDPRRDLRRRHALTCAVVLGALAAPHAARAQSVAFGTGDPAAISNSNGLLEVFAPALDGAVYHRAEQSPGGSWTAWAAIGGAQNIECIAVASNSDHRLELFARNGAKQLVHAWQGTANGAWSAWYPLMSASTPTDSIASCPVAAANSDGRLEVFGINRNGDAFHLWQDAASFNGWTQVQAFPQPSTAIFTIRVAQNAPDARGFAALEVFATTNAGSVIHAWQTGPSAPFSNWATLVPSCRCEIAVARNGDGRLELFYTGPQATPDVFHLWQTAPNSGWSAVASLGHSGIATDVSVGQNGDGRLEVFVTAWNGNHTANDHIDHAWQVAPGAGWSSWFSLGGTPESAPTTALDNALDPTTANRHLALFDLDRTGDIQLDLQNAGGWPGWSNLGPNPAPPQVPGAPALQASAGNGSVALSWTGSGFLYSIARSSTPGQETLHASTYATSYIDTGLGNGTQQCYVVRATSMDSTGPASNEVCVTPTSPPVTVTTGTMWLSLAFDSFRRVYDVVYDPANPWVVTAGAPAPAGATVTGISFNDGWTDGFGGGLTGVDLALDNTAWQIEVESIVANHSSSSAYNGLPTQGVWAALPIGSFIGSSPPNLPIAVSWRH
jgi:hypothetical protein